jgi:hypothetical protein
MKLSKLVLLFILLLGLSLVTTTTVLAAEADCIDDKKTWNQDQDPNSKNTILSPKFSCQCAKDGGSTKFDHTRIDTDVCFSLCGSGCASGEKCYCARKPDCESIKGVCFSGGKTLANLNIDDGILMTKYEADNNIKFRKKAVQYRCPGGKGIQCFVPEPPPATPPVVKQQAQQTNTTPAPFSRPVINLSDCCGQIVPDEGAYATGDYNLGHLVQTAINIYECILCMVAAAMLLMFVLGAFVFMTSTGNQQQVSRGKQIILGAVIGSIIVFGSILIVNFTVKALGGSFSDEAGLKVYPGGK